MGLLRLQIGEAWNVRSGGEPSMRRWGRVGEMVWWNGVDEGFFEEEPTGAAVTLREANGVAPEVVEVLRDSQKSTSALEHTSAVIMGLLTGPQDDKGGVAAAMECRTMCRSHWVA